MIVEHRADAICARPTVSLEAAQELIATAFEIARGCETTDVPIACAVVDSAGELVAFAADDGCGPLPRRLAARKAYTAVLLRRTTTEVRAAVAAGTLDLAQLRDADLVTMLGGAPIVIDGQFIGAVGVSGMPPEQDALLADAVLRNFALT